jgi:hypothetical protein
MVKKSMIYITLFSFLNFVGCYSTEIVSPNEYKEYEISGGEQSDILVKMKNLKEYRFARGKYSIKADYLYGNGFEMLNYFEATYANSFKGSIPLSQIESIQYKEENTTVTTFLVLGIIVGAVVIAMGQALKDFRWLERK